MRWPANELGHSEGFALLAVLWVITGVAVLGLGANLIARNAVGTATYRADATRAFWRAEDCLARARAVIDEALRGRVVEDFGYEVDWSDLGNFVPNAPLVTLPDCDVSMRALGSTLDVNAAEHEALSAFFLALGMRPGRADSLADAILDWRDEDDVPRPFGAEREWYESQGRHPPRNGPIADPRELRRIRGLDAMEGLDTLIGVQPARISLLHAPPAVLASLPGFGAEAVQRVLDMRSSRPTKIDLAVVANRLSAPARRRLMERFPEAAGRSTTEADGWVVAAQGYAGTPPVTVTVEVTLVRAGDRAAIVRRKIWLQ